MLEQILPGKTYIQSKIWCIAGDPDCSVSRLNSAVFVLEDQMLAGALNTATVSAESTVSGQSG